LFEHIKCCIIDMFIFVRVVYLFHLFNCFAFSCWFIISMYMMSKLHFCHCFIIVVLLFDSTYMIVSVTLL